MARKFFGQIFVVLCATAASVAAQQADNLSREQLKPLTEFRQPHRRLVQRGYSLIQEIACVAWFARSMAKYGSFRRGRDGAGASNMCLSQAGPAAGRADLARSSSIVASSTLDPAHGAALAVDGLASSYWVSKLDETGPVSLTVEFDKPSPVLEIHLAFEFVPSTFAVQTLGESGKWTDQFATDANFPPCGYLWRLAAPMM